MKKIKIVLVLIVFISAQFVMSCKSSGCSTKKAPKSDTENYYSPKNSAKTMRKHKNTAKCTKW